MDLTDIASRLTDSPLTAIPLVFIAGVLTFWPSEFSRLRLQGSSDIPGWRPDPIWAVFLASEFAIGAHGAHKF